MTTLDYFAGHPWPSPPARRAMELHRLIGVELDADEEPEVIAAYRAELDEIRSAA